MGKNIVICSDGTAATAAKNRGTNVFKLFEAVELHDHKADITKRQQVAFYDDGVGSGKWKPLKFLGGAVGFGLSRNVRQLYTSLVRAYRPGDHIYLFGFSRGGFTVRTLVGFMMSQGLLDASKFHDDAELVRAVRFLYKKYRWSYRAYLQRLVDWVLHRSARLAARCAFDWWLVSGNTHPMTPRIRFIGVWDTVDAVGFPIPCVAECINRCIYRFKFRDLVLNSEVELARQALSIDDERLTFHPLVWDETGEKHDRLQQVWFAGVHCNVGGGYPKQGLSLVTLDWMMTEAEDAGLRFIPEGRERYRDARSVHDALYNSRAGFALFYRYRPRDIWKIFTTSGAVPKIHISVLERLSQLTEGYAPGGIPKGSEFVPTRDGSAWSDKVSEHGPEIAQYLAGAFDEYATHTKHRASVQGIKPTTLLDLVHHHVRTRFVFHVFLLVAVTGLVVIALITAWTATDIWLPTSGSDWACIGRVLSDGVRHCQWPALLALFFLGVVIPTCAIVMSRARRRMDRVLSAFWHRAGLELRRRWQ